MTTDAPDTSAVQGTAPYWNRVAPCGCRSVPDGQHVPPCAHCTTPEAKKCPVCGIRTATDADGACGRCGRPK